MTRKDYVAISRIIKEQLGDTHFLLPVTNTLCSYFKDENPKFNEDLFKAACFNKKVIEVVEKSFEQIPEVKPVVKVTIPSPLKSPADDRVAKILNQCDSAMDKLTEKNAKASKKKR